MDRYISVKALKQIISEEGTLSPNYYSAEEIEADIMDMIDKVPAADVKPVGEWKLTPQGVIVCSNCGWQALRSFYCGITISYMQEASNFCPHCGVDMRGDLND